MKLIPMIHLKSLFGAGSITDVDLDKVYEHCIHSLQTLVKAGYDCIMFENDNDSPYTEFVSQEQAMHFAYLMGRIQSTIPFDHGYTVLLNDWKTALTLAKLSGGSFIRLDTFVDEVKRVSDGLILTPNPNDIITYKKKIGAEHIKIYTDVHVKHAVLTNLTKTLEQSINDAIICGSDGVIVTGKWTGQEPNLSDIKKAQQIIAGRVPLLIGSGITNENIKLFATYADIGIVGTSIKTGDMIDLQKARILRGMINL